ncbi:hypothetical protein [Vibrio casei]
MISEWVETQYQADILKKLGCQQAQGFLYSHPCPLDEWANFVS